PSSGGGGTPYQSPAAPAPAPSTPAGPGPYASWGDVPGGEQNVIESLRNEFEGLIGYQAPLGTAEMLELANAQVQTLTDFGKFAAEHWPGGAFSNVWSAMPWAKYG